MCVHPPAPMSGYLVTRWVFYQTTDPLLGTSAVFFFIGFRPA